MSVHAISSDGHGVAVQTCIALDEVRLDSSFP